MRKKSILLTFFLMAIAHSQPAGNLGTPQTSLTASTGYQNAPLPKNTHPLPFKAGDALQIVTYPDTLAFPSGHYPIDGEGYVDFPIIGYIKVTTMSVEQLVKLLAEKYVDYMRYPLMTIRPVIRIAFNGGFFRPGLYWIDPHASLWEALKEAGGTQRMDGFKRLQWERSDTIVNDNLAPVLQEGRSLYQIGFQTGDHLTVLQQPYRTKWEVFRSDIVPLITVSLGIVISALTLYNTAEYYRSR